MKKIIYFLTIIIVLILNSCSELLDPKAITTLTEEYAVPSYSYTMQRSTALYTFLPNGFLYIDGAMMASASDEAEHTLETSNIQKFNTGSWNAVDNPDGSAWNRNFQGIYACNLFLATSDSVYLDYLKLDPNSSQQQAYQNRLNDIKRWKYEARFLRAFYYFELVKRYGGVPLLTDPYGLDKDFTSIPRSSLNNCIDFIANECDSAATVLPNSQASDNLGRATKGAALALKARVKLYAASDLFNKPEAWASGYSNPEFISLTGKSQEERWIEAAAACNEYISYNTTSRVYSVTANYQTIFRSFDNQEIIFTRRAAASNTFERANYPIGYDLGQSGTTPSMNLIDAYQMLSDGSKFDWNNPDHAQNPYTDRDPRLAFTILLNNTAFKGRPVESFTGGRDGKGVTWATKTGHYLLKYIDPDLDLLQNRTSVHSWIIMRHSEMLLNYAEAMNEAYGPVNNNGYSLTAVAAINQVRNRTNVRMPQFPATISRDELRELIRTERQVELAFEDHRFWDVRRWMIAPATLNIPLRGVEITKIGENNFNYNPVKVEDRYFQTRMYLYPIPQGDLNTAGWKQNPLW